MEWNGMRTDTNSGRVAMEVDVWQWNGSDVWQWNGSGRVAINKHPNWLLFIIIMYLFIYCLFIIWYWVIIAYLRIRRRNIRHKSVFFLSAIIAHNHTRKRELNRIFRCAAIGL